MIKVVAASVLITPPIIGPRLERDLEPDQPPTGLELSQLRLHRRRNLWREP